MPTEETPPDKNDEIDDAELTAMAKILAALKHLEPSVQQSVIEWAVRRFKLKSPYSTATEVRRAHESAPAVEKPNPAKPVASDHEGEREPTDNGEDSELEGVNVVAQKWVRRSGLTEEQIGKLFSLGVDDIDVVAKSVPGNKKIDRLRNVLLLQGVAGYLSSGVARVDWAKLKEAAGHYNADAGGNFASYLKSFGAEATGSAASGYTLTSRGLNEAKDLIIEMSKPAEGSAKS